MPIDPLLSFVVAGVLVWGGWRLVRDTTMQLMEGAPADVDMDEIHACMLAEDGVSGLHHVHLWLLPDGRVALSAHVLVRHMHDWPQMLPQLLSALQACGIAHATLQAEDQKEGCPEHVASD